jgi:hypothetical protein
MPTILRDPVEPQLIGPIRFVNIEESEAHKEWTHVIWVSTPTGIEGVRFANTPEPYVDSCLPYGPKMDYEPITASMEAAHVNQQVHLDNLKLHTLVAARFDIQDDLNLAIANQFNNYNEAYSLTSARMTAQDIMEFELTERVRKIEMIANEGIGSVFCLIIVLFLCSMLTIHIRTKQR